MYETLRASDLRAVLSSLGFSEWKERKGGTEFYGQCPIHDGHNQSSFSFDASGRFHCFACQAKGKGAIDLVKLVKGCGFKEAVTLLEQLSPTPLPHTEAQTPAPPATGPLENSPYKASYSKYFVPSTWLKARGLEQTTLDYYGVGEYNNPARKSVYSGSVMFPIRRVIDGEVVGFLSRNTGEPTQLHPKYLWPKGVAKSLEVFGAYQLKTELQRLAPTARLKVCYLVESPLCVMKFHQLGLPACSPYGWSVSEQQVTVLSQLSKSWLYLPDRDKRDSIGSVLKLLGQACFVKCPEYPASDPENLSPEQIQSLT